MVRFQYLKKGPIRYADTGEKGNPLGKDIQMFARDSPKPADK